MSDRQLTNIYRAAWLIATAAMLTALAALWLAVTP